MIAPGRCDPVVLRGGAIFAIVKVQIEQAQHTEADRFPVRRLRHRTQRLDVPVDETRVEAPRPERIRVAEFFQERNIGLRARDQRLAERLGKPLQRLVARRPVGDHLGDHRIVIRRHHVAGAHARIDANSLAFGKFQRPELARRRQERVLRVLGIEPRLDRVAIDREIGLGEGQLFARGGAKLQFDQVEPGDRLRDRVLHLQPRVHLHEEEPVGAEALAAVGDELHRSGAHITHRARGLDRGLAHGGAHLGRHAGGRRFLDDLLVPPLQRAIALEQMHHVAVGVGEDLDLDMARREDVFLHQHARIAECARGLALRALQGGVEIRHLLDPPHPFAAAARDRLDEHRIADLVGLLAQEIRLLPGAVIARHDRNAGLLRPASWPRP